MTVSVYASLRPDFQDPPDLIVRAREGSFRLLTDVEVEEMVPPEDLIEGLFSEQAIVLLYSYPGNGKTFVSLDWALCVATGEPWFGRAVTRPGPTIYVAGEGAWTIGPRLRAWKYHRGRWGRQTSLRIHDEPVDLMTGAHVGALAMLVREERIRLVIFDTLAASLEGGDENSAKDMGAAIANLNKIRKAGAAVMVIHHTGKNDQSERGSLALRGAADTVIKLKSSGGLTLVCEKQRDADRFHDIPLTLRVVQPPLGKASCVVEQPTASLLGTGSNLPPWAPQLLRIVDANPDLTNRRFKELSGLKKCTFDRYLRYLTQETLVDFTRQGRNTKYRLTEFGKASLGTIDSGNLP